MWLDVISAVSEERKQQVEADIRLEAQKEDRRLEEENIVGYRSIKGR